MRANYRNIQKDVERTTEYLQLFLRNLLMGERNELRNRYLHIRWNKMMGNDMVANEAYVPFVSRHGSVQEEIGSVEMKKSSVEMEKGSVEMEKGSVENVKSSVEIIRMLEGDPKVTAAQMAEVLGISTRAVEKQLANLRKKGVVVRIGPNKGGHWEVAKNNDN